MATTPSSNSGVSEVRILRSRRVPLGENAEDDVSAERPASTADVVKRTPQQLITKFFNVVSSSGRSSEVNATNKTLADASMWVNTSATPDSGLQGTLNAPRSDSLFQSAFSAPRSRNASGKQRNAVAKAMSSARRRLLVTETPTGSPTTGAGGMSFANPSFSQPVFARFESDAGGASLPRSAEMGARPRARASRRSSVDPQAVISASRDRLERLKTWTSIENLLEEQRRELGDYVQRAKRWRLSRGRASTSLNVSFAQQVENVVEPEGAGAIPTGGETDEAPLDDVAVERQIRQSLETDDTVLLRRQKQLDYGKHTPAYANYLASIPKTLRSEEQPRTPNKFLKLARRDWDTRVRNWRRALHQFDTDANGSSAADLSTSALTASVLDENAMDVGGATRSPQPHSKFSTYINERSNSMSNSLLGKRRAPHTPTGKSAAAAAAAVPEAISGSPRAAPRGTVLHSELTQDLVRLSTVSEETCSSPAKRLRSSSIAVKK